ncbi:MAG: MMPL family transporter [Mycolicibacterium neoaurum]|nr:MMPL family transporter [Mycolicibacterium neoaurum]
MMIGLGVGIDYAVFIVSRYREGLHEGRSRGTQRDRTRMSGRPVRHQAASVGSAPPTITGTPFSIAPTVELTRSSVTATACFPMSSATVRASNAWPASISRSSKSDKGTGDASAGGSMSCWMHTGQRSDALASSGLTVDTSSVGR